MFALLGGLFGLVAIVCLLAFSALWLAMAIQSFRTSILWGLAFLFVPLSEIFYSLSHGDESPTLHKLFWGSLFAAIGACVMMSICGAIAG